MKRLIIVVVACALAPLASAELYKYVDKDGKTVYTDQPPPDAQAKSLHVAPAPAVPAPAAKTFAERDKELQKARDAARDKEKKADTAAAEAKQKAERCEQAQSNLKLYTEGGRILGTDEKGERGYLSDEQIAAERVKAQRLVDEACGKQ